VKALRITLLAIVGITVVIAAAAAIFVATFDANRYKPEIEQLVLENTGRVLTIDGDVHLTLFPNIGAEVGQATLSDKDPDQAFITFQSTNVSVELWPLLSGEVFVDGVTIDGLSATVTRDKAGAFNFADLVSGDQTADDKANQAESAAGGSTNGSTSSSANPASSFALDIRSVTLTNANLTFNDLQNRMDWTISELNLSTGQIARQASGKLKLAAKVKSQTMALDGKLNVESDYKIDLATQRLSLNQISSQLSGNWRDLKDLTSDLKLNFEANLKDNAFAVTDLDLRGTANLAGQAIELTTTASGVQSKGNDIEVKPSTLNLTIKESGRALSTELALPTFTLTGETLAINGLDTGLSVTDPALGKEPLKVTAKGDLTLNTKAQTVATVLSGQFDGSPIKARVDVAGFDQPTITFDVALDALKLDRFGATTQAASPRSETNAAENEITDGASNGRSNGRSATQATQTDTIDLSALKGPNIKGKVSIGQVLSGGLREGLRINQVKANVALNQGKLQVAPHSAQLFGGKLEGSLLVDAYSNRFTLKENITGIKLDSLLMAMGQEPNVTGQGALVLDLATTGTTVASLEQNLSGNARVNLKDGSVKGIDIGKILNNVRSMLGKAPTQQGSGSGQTAFTELTASATIAKGIATNKDLSVKAPLFRLEGAGTINIPDSSLNYLAKVAVVETSEGQGGKDLAALKGVTVPIRISGQFDDPKYSVDVASLAAELAKSKLGDQLGDRARDEINKVAPGLGDAIKGLFGR